MPVKKRAMDFLDILIKARDDDGKGLTFSEIRDEVDTFMFEGQLLGSHCFFVGTDLFYLFIIVLDILVMHKTDTSQVILFNIQHMYMRFLICMQMLHINNSHT